ncbi:hypothetical protein PInf_017080 [Phytophthora infestans]|nr:hypothetical protein PInf_017080 [Phytophthora infestans]
MRKIKGENLEKFRQQIEKEKAEDSNTIDRLFNSANGGKINEWLDKSTFTTLDGMMRDRKKLLKTYERLKAEGVTAEKVSKLLEDHPVFTHRHKPAFEMYMSFLARKPSN